MPESLYLSNLRNLNLLYSTHVQSKQLCKIMFDNVWSEQLRNDSGEKLKVVNFLPMPYSFKTFTVPLLKVVNSISEKTADNILNIFHLRSFSLGLRKSDITSLKVI